MLPYLERFAPTRGHNSGFQTPLVFDDCGITLEGFVCFVCLLSAVWRSLGGRQRSALSLLPLEWRDVKGGIWDCSIPKTTCRKQLKIKPPPPSSFLPGFFLFVCLFC